MVKKLINIKIKKAKKLKFIFILLDIKMAFKGRIITLCFSLGKQTNLC